jgi:methyltransferase (TIGR00027 family)
MARTDNDTWDLASSVGATATMVAAARAAATRAENPVINDPFAEPLVRAVGVDFFTRLATGEFNPEDLGSEAGGPGGVGLNRFADGMAARTRFFDDFFLDAADAGIRQAVILAAGLDARAYRLQWPAGMVVFEIDQPEVIEFKTTTMAGLGAEPTADRRPVAVDLRNDWPAALAGAGFDPASPTAWIAEGLFGYLPPEAQDRLLDAITELSAPGSRLAAEGVPSHPPVDDEEAHRRMEEVSRQWRAQGFDLDFKELIYLGERAEVTGYLDGHGWTTTAITASDLLVQCGLPPVDDGAQGDADYPAILYISAQR